MPLGKEADADEQDDVDPLAWCMSACWESNVPAWESTTRLQKDGEQARKTS